MNQAIAIQNNSITSIQREEIISGMVKENQVIIRAALAPKLENIASLTATDEMIDIFSGAVAMSGQKIDGETIQVHANEVYNWLIFTFPEITIEEIRAAVRAGVYEEYGEYWGLNPKSYVMFVTAYMQSERRKIATATYQRQKEKQVEPTRKLTVKEWIALIEYDFDLLKRSESKWIMFMAKKYIFLRKYGLLQKPTPEAWKGWLQRAKTEREWVVEKVSKKGNDNSAVTALQTIYSELEQTGKIPKDEYCRLVNGARKLRYIAFLEKMAADGMDFIFYKEDTQQ